MLRRHDGALREPVSAACRRGKIDIRVSAAGDASDDWPQPSADQLSRPARLERSVAVWLPKATPLSVHDAAGGVVPARGSPVQAPRNAARCSSASTSQRFSASMRRVVIRCG